jgi:hypothetical protein
MITFPYSVPAYLKYSFYTGEYGLPGTKWSELLSQILKSNPSCIPKIFKVWEIDRFFPLKNCPKINFL